MDWRRLAYAAGYALAGGAIIAGAVGALILAAWLLQAGPVWLSAGGVALMAFMVVTGLLYRGLQP